jgi:hypothetical protein
MSDFKSGQNHVNIYRSGAGQYLKTLRLVKPLNLDKKMRLIEIISHTYMSISKIKHSREQGRDISAIPLESLDLGELTQDVPNGFDQFYLSYKSSEPTYEHSESALQDPSKETSYSAPAVVVVFF